MSGERCINCPNCGAELQMSVRVKAHPPGIVGREPSLGRFGFNHREAQIAVGILEAKSTREIAKEMGTSPAMIRKMTSKQIYNKVGCSNRSEFFSIVLSGGGAMA